MTRERETSPLSAASFRYEVQILAGDLQTVSNILIQISHADIELQHGWMSFFGPLDGPLKASPSSSKS